MNNALLVKNDSFLVLAVEAAKAAGQIILQGRKGSMGIEEKSMANFVTRIDKDAEAAVRQILARHPEACPVLGEEEGGEVLEARRFWVVDPLDGTTNFIKGIPYYSVSIALAERDPLTHAVRSIRGVVYNPLSEELFWAAEGKGAWLTEGEDKPVSLRVKDTSRLQEALLITGFYYDRGEKMRQTLRQIEDFFDRGMICVRRFGSAALDLCQVAAGRSEGFWEHHLNPWDYAAGQLLVKEAGGLCTDWTGTETGLEPGAVLACVPGLQEQMMKILEESSRSQAAGGRS